MLAQLMGRNAGRSGLLAAGVMVGALALGWAAMTVAAPAARADADAPGAKKTVFITGANRGIGLEFAKEYAAAGWIVIGTAREPGEAKDLKAIGESVRVVQLDVASAESVAAMAKALSGAPIDLLINNAGMGVGVARDGKLENVKVEDVEKVMSVNALGPMRVTQALLPNLRAGKSKMVVSISSGLGSIEMNKTGGYFGYRESKAALDMFMRSIAAGLKDEGFICIAMSPGWVKTDMGGPNATLTPEQSVSGMRKVIEGLKTEDTGKFWNYDGGSVAW